MTQKKASEFVFEEDLKRKNYVKKYFNKDINDPLLYDMVINVDSLVREEAIQAIGDLVLNRHQR